MSLSGRIINTTVIVPFTANVVCTAGTPSMYIRCVHFCQLVDADVHEMRQLLVRAKLSCQLTTLHQ
jgi:hypothetical protein